MSHSISQRQRQLPRLRLNRSFSRLEDFGFSLTGLLVWPGTVIGMHHALGPQALLVWLPAVIVAILLNLQLARLGSYWPQMSGGTSNYATRLLQNYPGLGLYAASGYFISWAALIPINAIVLTNLISAILTPYGLETPHIPLKIGFTLIAFILAFSGNRALAILHLIFMLPAIGFLLVFAIQGLGWLLLSPESPGFFPTDWQGFAPIEWAKWYLVAVYAVYASEGAAAFIADSRHPSAALHYLKLTAGLLPIVYLGGSWVVMRLASDRTFGDDALLNLIQTARAFWGESATVLIVLLVAFASLLSCATTVALSARVLYQLALDGYISPVFGVVSRRGVLGPALSATLAMSVACLLWGDVLQIISITGIGYLISMMAIHWGLWLNRGKPEILWPWWSLGFLGIEAVVLIVGGLAWNISDFILGAIAPLIIIVLDRLIYRLPQAIFQPAWWTQQYRVQRAGNFQDFVGLQVSVLVFLVCGATATGWFVHSWLQDLPPQVRASLLAIVVLTAGFFGVAITCWTSLPQVASIIEAREQLEMLFTIARDAIGVVDRQGMIRQVNPAMTALFQAAQWDLIGCHLKDYLTNLPDSVEDWPQRSEQQLILGGRAIALEMSTSELSYNDFEENLIILRDITEQKQAELALRQSEAQLREQAQQLELKVEKRTAQLKRAKEIAEVANRAKSTFIASMSHELRTPLNAILGFAQIMTRSATLSPEDREHVNIISQSGEHLLALINNVLDLSKIEAGKIHLNPKNFDLYSLLEHLEDMLHLKAAAKGLYLQVECQPNVPQYLYADEVKLRQILINLIYNGIKFTQVGGVFLGVALSSKASHKQVRIRFSVEDTGIGIAETDLKRLFEAFTQTEAGKQAREGTGLGLTIARSFVQLMGGDIAVRSQLGVGTVFEFDIQATLVEANEVEIYKPQYRILALEPDRRRYRILIVDDKPLNRQLLVELLLPLGFELQEASNGQQAVEIWENWEPDLIWMDMGMPVMDGCAATRQIKGTEKGQATVVIALTANILEEQKAAMLSAGCDDFLSKPFREDDIFEMLHQYLGVRYICEDSHNNLPVKSQEVERLTSESLITVKVGVKQQLKKALLTGNIELMATVIQEIGKSDRPLAAAISDYWDRFEYQKILNILNNEV